MRELGPFVDGHSLYWSVEGRGRQSVTLDLRKPEGARLFRELAATADVVCENFRPGTLERWGIGPTDCDRRLVWVRISTYGQDGPNSSRPGLDRVGIGFGGLLHLTGDLRPAAGAGRRDDQRLPHRRVRRQRGVGVALRPGAHRRGGGDRRLPLRVGDAGARVDLRRLRPARRGAVPGGQPAGQLGAARQLPHGRRQVGVHRRRERRQLRPAGLLADGHGDRRRGRRSPTGSPGATRSTSSWRRGPGRWPRAEVVDACVAHDVPVATAYTAADIFGDAHIAAHGDLVAVDDPVIGPVRQQAPFPRFVGVRADGAVGGAGAGGRHPGRAGVVWGCPTPSSTGSPRTA